MKDEASHKNTIYIKFIKPGRDHPALPRWVEMEPSVATPQSAHNDISKLWLNQARQKNLQKFPSAYRWMWAGFCFLSARHKDHQSNSWRRKKMFLSLPRRFGTTNVSLAVAAVWDSDRLIWILSNRLHLQIISNLLISPAQFFIAIIPGGSSPWEMIHSRALSRFLR